MKKILLITNIPNPYRLPLFNELHTQAVKAGMELKVLFGAGGYSRRKFELDWSEADFSYEVLGAGNIRSGANEKTMVKYKGLPGKIRREKADVIIVSGFSLATLQVWLRSWFVKTTYIIWSGSVEQAGWYDSPSRKIFRRILVRRAKACVAYGSRAKQYLVRLGARAEKVFIAINTVDTEFFAAETRRLKPGIHGDDKKHLLFVGYLEPRKNAANLVSIAAKLAKKRQDFVLDIVGSGPEESALEKQVREEELEYTVRFHGFRQKQELPQFFAGASCFLFQTDFDIWGLVLNEAMAAGLPCISSVNAGAATDLVDHGINGYVADFNDHDSVLVMINDILDHPEMAEKMGLLAASTIREKANLAISAQGFMKAIRSVNFASMKQIANKNAS